MQLEQFMRYRVTRVDRAAADWRDLWRTTPTTDQLSL